MSLLVSRAIVPGLLLALAVSACGKSGAEPPAPGASPVPAAGAAPGAAGPSGLATAGATAPDFTLKDLDGKEVRLSSFRGKTVVLEWYNPDCPFVRKQHTEGPLATMPDELTKKGAVWLAVNSGAPGKQGHGVERNKASVAEYGIGHPILIDEPGAVGKLYQAKTTPHMVVITPEGALAYMGAIDNAPMGRVPESGFVNYVTEALADLEAGRAVRTPQTKGYGCGVKYAD
ncbi:MAG: redoxin domain-containing protein [Deltaproteobacteria bacterium]|nr:redoxin domain-containing protein [Deltaproteobacteria bacterium]